MDKITIIGMGLIGTSLGMALKRAQLDLNIVGTDRDRGIASRAQRRGAVDSMEPNLLTAVREARLVIIATPVGAIEDIMKVIGPELDDECVVTDTGTTKVQVLQWAEQHLPSTVNFVGGHPMAGKELSGPDAAQADLFHGANYCVLPAQNVDDHAVKTIVSMVETVGAKPYFVDPVEHDSYVAAVSNLPMILSTVLVNVASGSPSWPEIAKLASTGFRDVSRLASGDPEMSRDICLTNPEHIIHWIDQFIIELYAFRGLVQGGGDGQLTQVFDSAWESRDRWLQNKVTAPSADQQVALPTTAESMGGLLFGDRAAGRMREMMNWQREDKGKRGSDSS